MRTAPPRTHFFSVDKLNHFTATHRQIEKLSTALIVEISRWHVG